MTSTISFKQSKFYRGPLLQTIASHFTNNAEAPLSEQLIVDLNDGDKIILEIDQKNLTDPSPVLMLFHGLGGCSRSPYLLSIANAAQKEGIITVRFNHRGCGPGGRALAKQIYHSGRTNDLLLAIRAVAAKYPKSKIFLCGFSLSANMLLKLISEWQDIRANLPSIAGSMAVCPPLDLNRCSLRLSSRSGKIFDLYFSLRLRNEIKHLEKQTPEKLRFSSKKKVLSVRAFDHVYTAPLGGYKSRDDYYKTNSSLDYLIKIRSPTFILGALDDPIVDGSDYHKLKKTEHLDFEIYEHGGHMGFLHHKNIMGFGTRWMDYRIISWVKSAHT